MRYLNRADHSFPTVPRGTEDPDMIAGFTGAVDGRRAVAGTVPPAPASEMEHREVAGVRKAGEPTQRTAR